MKRREFLRYSAAVAGSAGADSLVIRPAVVAGERTDQPEVANLTRLPKRTYGKTGIELSVIGFGGIVVKGAEQDHANRVVAEAIEKGVNYFDVAPSYGDAEVKLGPALEPYRKDVFLACKTGQRQREGAAAELSESFRRLRTDYFDLYQLHAITNVEKDVDTVFVKGGAMEVLTEAKKQEQIRHLGFSAHSEEAALATMNRYDFDSILFPVNFATFHKGQFGPRVLAEAQSRGVARLALKAMARQRWPQGDPERRKYSKCWYQPLTLRDEARLGLYFTPSQSVTAAIPPGDESLFRMAVDLALHFRPLSAQEQTELQQKAESLNPIFVARR